MARRIGKVGRQKTHSGAKKRTDRTASGKFRMQKAAHSHRLTAKAARQKNLGTHRWVVSASDAKRFQALLPNK